MIHQMAAYVSGGGAEGRIRHETIDDTRKPGAVESDGVVHVVNTDPLESETARCTPGEFASDSASRCLSLQPAAAAVVRDRA